MALHAIDLFAGAGGFTEGASQAGIEVVWAANHNRMAVTTHAKNHPGTLHECQDLQLARWEKVPAHDVLMASPCCQGFSKARGKEREGSWTSRSTAFCVFNCAAVHRPKAIVVENVSEFLDWNESDDPTQVGSVFRTWRDLVCNVGRGYHFSKVMVDAADLGVPQHRERLFMVFLRKDLADTPLDLVPPQLTHRSAASILEHRDGMSWSRVSAKAATTQGFVARTEARRFPVGTPFLVPYYGGTLKTGLGRDLSRPVGTITTKARYGLVDDSHKWLRMWTVREYQRAMAFPDRYVLPTTQVDAIQQLGNAVCPPVATWVLNQVRAKLTGSPRRKQAA